MRRVLSVSLLASVLALTAPPRSAGAIEDLISPRSMAMGNSLRADATGALGPQLNPAGMAMKRGYSIELMYGFRVQDVGSNLNLSIVDSITSKVAAGVYYSFVWSRPKLHLIPNGGTTVVTPDVTREGHETGVALALPLGDKFGLGVTMKYLTVSTTATAQKGLADLKCATPLDGTDTVMGGKAYTCVLDDSSLAGNSIARGFSIDAGISARLGDKFQVGLVGYNLIPLRSVEAPIGMGLGLAFKPTPMFTIALDTVIQFNQWNDYSTSTPTMYGNRFVTGRLGGGIEWLIIGKVPLRLGYLWDSGPGKLSMGDPNKAAAVVDPAMPLIKGLASHYLSAGLGYQGQKFAVDVSYRQKFAYGNESILIAGVRVFLQ